VWLTGLHGYQYVFEPMYNKVFSLSHAMALWEWLISHEWKTYHIIYCDSQMAFFPLNKSKSTKTHLIQSQCWNMVWLTVWHHLIFIRNLLNIKFFGFKPSTTVCSFCWLLETNGSTCNDWYKYFLIYSSCSFYHTLAAPTAPGKKMGEDTLTYLNQG
jgi:hypothetical protein